MKYKILILAVCCSLLSACKTTQVHLFAYHLESHTTEKITNSLEKAGLNVVVNQHYFPTSVEHNALVYSALFDKSEVNTIISTVNALGYAVSDTSIAFRQGHSFSEDQLGLYLFPTNYTAEQKVFKLPLVNEYSSIDCDTSFTLNLFESATKNTHFKLVKAKWNEDQKDYIEYVTNGEWRVENEIVTLSHKTSNSHYFISRSKESTPYGLRHGIQLTPITKPPAINQNTLIEQACKFDVGMFVPE